MFNIKVLCFFIFTLSFVLSFPDNFYKSLEENYGSDNEDVAKTIREESVDQDGNKHTRDNENMAEIIREEFIDQYGNKHTRDNENMAEIIREEFIDQYGNKHTREFEIKRSAVTNKRKKRDSDNLIGNRIVIHSTVRIIDEAGAIKIGGNNQIEELVQIIN
ncbi:uncharacterized protein LOC111631289 [Centruroides sculpturatus]|uniref:uncharacterized protein LOC111631289 n=1 Tax=Centruroides sculpturatus TaxID=218467 RepID=UPI000C6CC395|nr:uncharacterized protein LOC111631289 [Centruroides sculpturatus]